MILREHDIFESNGKIGDWRRFYDSLPTSWSHLPAKIVCMKKNTLSEDTSELMPFTFAVPEYLIGIVVIGLFIIGIVYVRAVSWTISYLYYVFTRCRMNRENRYSQMYYCVLRHVKE